MKEITKERYHDLFGYNVPPGEEEIAWYLNEDKTMRGVILTPAVGHERHKEYSPILLKKDESGEFKTVDFPPIFKNLEDAEEWLRRRYWTDVKS